MHRVNALSSHLQPSPCIGEMENRAKDESSASSFKRVALKMAFVDSSQADERYGGPGDMCVLEGELLLPPKPSKTFIVFMHPSGIQNLLPMPMAMAKSGLHVVCCTSRYPNNDTCLIMEKVLVDLSECIKHVKLKFGYEKVLLAGWSGGGSLSSFYQAQAELPAAKRLQRTPAGDRVDLSGLEPVNGMLILAAHTSRAKIFTEWIDPAVMDESDPGVRDVELDLWDPRNPNKAPFTKEYVARFRQAQIDRNRRITKWAQAKLREVEAEGETRNSFKMVMRDHPFVVRCTQADPRRLDLQLDPNGRVPTTLEQLAQENHSPVGLARFTTCRAWLSQWSYDESNADGVSCLATVKAPILVLQNGADHLVPHTHGDAMFAAVSHNRKKFVKVDKATHYYFGQKDLMAYAIGEIKAFMVEHQLLV